MKIAIPTSGTDLNAPLDARFGRAKYFLIYDTETKETTVIENLQNLNAAQGAGIQSGQTIVRAGAQVVLAGHCGPKAFAVLAAAGINVFLATSGSVGSAVDAFLAGKLTAMDSADVEGHW
ncbi:MAG: dinitrogenase iron-molybdenum cofactor biosynthesis protein [Myxococcales bacterium]|nr:dinitrogenase iron-molybdenum cofactor biosynthesis protein [Myxococcales bacterium]